MNRHWRASLMRDRRDGIGLLVASVVAGLFSLSSALPIPLTLGLTGVAHAQTTVTQIFKENADGPQDQMLLESDQLIYDNDRQLVIAIGNVQIAYGDYTLVARKVEYSRLSGRVIAIGNVEILEPNGNRIFAGRDRYYG